MSLAPYRKTVTAVITVVLTWGTTAYVPDGSVDRGEAWGLLVGLAGACGVYAVANAPMPRENRPLRAERGAVEPGSFALGIIAGVLIGFLLWATR